MVEVDEAVVHVHVLVQGPHQVPDSEVATIGGCGVLVGRHSGG